MHFWFDGSLKHHFQKNDIKWMLQHILGSFKEAILKRPSLKSSKNTIIVSNYLPHTLKELTFQMAFWFDFMAIIKCIIITSGEDVTLMIDFWCYCNNLHIKKCNLI